MTLSANLADMKELGLFGISIPDAHGGIGLSMAQKSDLVFELGQAMLADSQSEKLARLGSGAGEREELR